MKLLSLVPDVFTSPDDEDAADNKRRKKTKNTKKKTKPARVALVDEIFGLNTKTEEEEKARSSTGAGAADGVGLIGLAGMTGIPGWQKRAAQQQDHLESTAAFDEDYSSASSSSKKGEGGKGERSKWRFPPRTQRQDVFVGKILPALRYHYETFKHLNVAKPYRVPDEPGVPDAIRGFALGKRVDNIRTRGDFVRKKPEYLEMLRNAGGEEASGKFVWKSSDFIFDHQILPCLRYFKRKHKHLIVPRNYVVPEVGEGDESDELLRRLAPFNRGFLLGRVVHDIRDVKKGFYLDQEPERLQKLANLDFPWENKAILEWEAKHLPAFLWFKKRHGHLGIPAHYRCPAGAEAAKSGLAPMARGLHLGELATRLRGLKRNNMSRSTKKGVMNDPARMNQLEQIGFVWDIQSFFFQRTVLPAVTFFVARYGHLSPPEDYVVPWGIKDVPRDAWGMNLHHTIISRVTLCEPATKWLHWTSGSVEVRQARIEALRAVTLHARDKYADEVLSGGGDGGGGGGGGGESESELLPSWDDCCEKTLEFLRERLSKSSKYKRQQHGEKRNQHQ